MSDRIADYAIRKRLEAMLRSRASQARTRYPLSHGQRSLLFLHEMNQDGAAYNVAFAARVTGGLDPAAFHSAVRSLVGRHTALRSTFDEGDGDGYQTVHGWLEPDFARVDAHDWDEPRLNGAVHLDYRKKLDIAAGPPIRVRVYAVARDEAVVLLVIHHLACDFWSLDLMLTELAELYSAEVDQRPALLPQHNVPYSDFVAYQRERLAGPQGMQARSYWQQQLSGRLGVADWPAFRVDPADSGGASMVFAFPGDVAKGVFALAKDESVTPYAVLLTAFQVLVSRYTGQHDVFVGTPVADRADPAFFECVGCFVDPAVMRADLSDAAPFRDQLRRTRRSVAEALEHRDYPFELLVSELAPRRVAGRNPVFQAMFIYQQPHRFPGLAGLYAADPDAAPVPWAGLTLLPFRLAQQEDQLELLLEVVQDRDRLVGVLKYRTSVFSSDAARRAIQHYTTLLRGAIAAPGRSVAELPLSPGIDSPVSRRPLRAPVAEDDSIVRRFAKTAAARTARVAVRCGADALTYGQLDELAGRWAARLRAEGVRRGDRVALLLEPSLQTVIAILAVLRARAAYLALDPQHPPARTRAVLADSEVRVALTERRLAGHFAGTPVTALVMEDTELPEARRDEDQAASRDLAYTVYTSGSTGTPKGIDVEHGNVLSLVDAMAEHIAPDHQAVWTLFHSTAFDFSVWELWGSLLSGACLVVVPTTTARSPDLMHLLLAEERVTHLAQTPSALHGLATVARQPQARKLALQHTFACGEPLPAPLARACLDWCGTLWNLYGPAETTVFVTAQRVRAEDCSDAGVPVGLPLSNAQVYILDGHGQPVPQEVAGELCIGGHCVARGYLNRPRLNRERFADGISPAGGRLYRTGDLARVNAAGLVEILGRADNQVKISGFRVELEEVEAHLDDVRGVARSAALVIGAGPEDRRLVACVIPEPGEQLTDAGLRAALVPRLPPYMVPSSVVFLDAFPLTANQKVDRARLARELPGAVAQAEPDAGGALSDPESRVTQVWEQVLHRQGFRADDNFFDLGGNSLLLLQVQRLLAPEAVGRPLTVSELFRYPTVESLAHRLVQATADLTTPQEPGRQRASRRRALTSDGAQADRRRSSRRRRPGQGGDEDA